MRQYQPQPNYIVINPITYQIIEYEAKTIDLWVLPGARRRRGPDGREWIEKNWETASVATGSGNKAKRRMGFVVKEHLGFFTWEKSNESSTL